MRKKLFLNLNIKLKLALSTLALSTLALPPLSFAKEIRIDLKSGASVEGEITKRTDEGVEVELKDKRSTVLINFSEMTASSVVDSKVEELSKARCDSEPEDIFSNRREITASKESLGIITESYKNPFGPASELFASGAIFSFVPRIAGLAPITGKEILP
jgi:hypothetical protein